MTLPPRLRRFVLTLGVLPWVNGCVHKYIAPQAQPLECTTYSGSPTDSQTCRSLPIAVGDRANPKLEYPSAPQQAGISGVVTLDLWVSPSSTVDSVSVAGSSALPFVRSVMSASRTWRLHYEAAPPPFGTSSLSSRSAQLSLDIVFRLKTCVTKKRPEQRVISLETSLLIEVIGCQEPLVLRRVGVHQLGNAGA